MALEHTIDEAEALIEKAGPTVDMIFPETARESEPGADVPNPQHIG